ncbi:MAG: DUF255 domain-containing protein [Verrucomicrobiota bacterium]|nr:DUF255 domain-containing protein [Verrucomicrobiota bacterium]
MPNHLHRESSPYLLQHASNPVAWYPWSEAAFSKAVAEDKPIFLSIGYSTCHWCHVMAHESFEDAEVAELLNQHFVCIKVDREERPDVDEQYMLATQVFTGQGGWPNSIWLNHTRKPWFAGTYFPKDDTQGRLGFLNLLHALSRTWKERRTEVEQQAERLADALRNLSVQQTNAPRREVSFEDLHHAAETFIEEFDPQFGGFGTSPKFPPHGILGILLAVDQKTEDETPWLVAERTLDAMAEGGLYDHVGGGFHRYATDPEWFRPHFEKMLYDNAQLLGVYARAFKKSEKPRYCEVIEETIAWLLREMRHPGGGFFSALDADSDGEEGKFYVWRHREIRNLVAPEHLQHFCRAFGVTEGGNYFEEASQTSSGANILFQALSPENAAKLAGIPADQWRALVREWKGRLLGERNRRNRPHLDDKIVCSWNALLISGLAEAARACNQEVYLQIALQAAEFLQANLVDDQGELLHTWRNGKGNIPGYLEDYAYLGRAYLDLFDATADSAWLGRAEELAKQMMRLFHDPARGGFFVSSNRHDAILWRSKGIGAGGSIPDPNGIAAEMLVRLGHALEKADWMTIGIRTILAFSDTMRRQPRASESILQALAVLEEIDPDHRWPRVPAQASAPDVIQAVAQAQVLRKTELSVHIDAHIAPGFHIYGPGLPPDLHVPTSLELKGCEGFSLSEIAFSDTVPFHDQVFGTELPVYQDRLRIEATVHCHQALKPGDYTLEFRLKFQACNQSACMYPSEIPLALKISLPADHSHDPMQQ